MNEVSATNVQLKNQYNYLCSKIGIKSFDEYCNVNIYIKEIIHDFMRNHKRVALYCYGHHTQMLMADYIAELRDIICIIDNGKSISDSEFRIIKDSDIEKNNLDGIIISSFIHKESIKKHLCNNYLNIDILDIYDALEKYDVFLEKDYFIEGAYQKYATINSRLRDLRKKETPYTMSRLLKEYVSIKDFRLAGKVARRIYDITRTDIDKEIAQTIDDLYCAELEAVKTSSQNNILMLCLDGMRRCDFMCGGMEKTYCSLRESANVYSNAYSFSTMTYESLIPVFSENSDQKTEYYLKNEVVASDCRFIRKALDEGRFISIYGDGFHYIYDDSIKYTGHSQTITEKLWDFVLDVTMADNGIFYLHELYESHFSFANPYTTDKIISNGSAMLFDYLPQNKGELQTDYKKQHKDALQYLDDTLAPFIDVIPCNIIIFADHGNIVLENGTRLSDIKPLQLTASEEWIQIPLIIKSHNVKSKISDELISLTELNDIMLSVMTDLEYKQKKKEYIKIGRSEIYNQQFKELYKVLSVGYNGEAFEGFIFDDGYKLLVYSNGKIELYRTNDDSIVDDFELKKSLFERIRSELTIL